MLNMMMTGVAWLLLGSLAVMGLVVFFAEGGVRGLVELVKEADDE